MLIFTHFWYLMDLIVVFFLVKDIAHYYFMVKKTSKLMIFNYLM